MATFYYVQYKNDYYIV